MPNTPSVNRLQLFNFILLASLWLVFFTQLWFEWNNNEQYGYGVFMPFIGIYLFYARWTDRPTPKPIKALSVLCILSLVSIILSLYPVKVIFEANADWRMIGWAHGLITLGGSFLLLAYWGGLPWVFHFSIPFIFFLFGIPWPTQIEVFAITKLLGFVTICTVEILNLSGVFAVQAGNLIKLTTGTLSMEEACSGVRSFQSSLMLGFFLGELFRLNFFKRIFIILSGACFAIFFNIIRTIILSFIAAYKSVEASQDWHDLASNAVFISCLVSLILLSLLLKPNQRQKKETHLDATAGHWLPIKGSLFLLVILLLTEPFVYAWFNFRPPLPYQGYTWTINWDKLEGLKENEMAYYIQDTLLYDTGHHTEWTTEGHYNWIAFYFSWDNPQGAQLAGFHGPDLCLPAAGWELHQKSDNLIWQRDDIELIFSSFSFKTAQQFVYIFYCQWDRSDYPYHTKQGTIRKDRLISAWNGHLKEGKIVLEVVITGMSSMQQAKEAMERFLDETVVIQKPKA